MSFARVGVLILALALAPVVASDDSDSKSKGVTPPVEGPHKNAIVMSLLSTFRSYVGIRESPMGSNNGPMVDKFNASCGLSPSDHAPWCASCTHYGYTQNGLKGHGAYSPDWYAKTKRVAPQDVKPGDVALVYFVSKGRYAHTIACVESVTQSAGRIVEVTTLEGNTNRQGSRDGDQFARRIRAADTLTFVRWF